jgi:broad specificity phosphatase PhoE
VTVVHWARHGENVANLSRTFSYRVFDGELTDRGVTQAGRLAEALRAAQADYGLLVCSPQRRARQTARIVSAALALPVDAELDCQRATLRRKTTSTTAPSSIASARCTATLTGTG